LRLTPAAGDPGANLRVRAFDLVRHSLADVVQQRAAAGGRDGRAELTRDEPGELSALDQVIEHVLTVARAELELSQELHQLWVEAVHPSLERRTLALLDYSLADLGLGVLIALLDERRVDPPVGDHPLDRDPGDLTSYAVEARQHHRRGSLVDDHVHAGQLLECPDVPAFTTDDPARQLVARQLNKASRRVARVLRRQPLHCNGEDAAGAPLRLGSRLLFDLLKPERCLVAGLPLHVGDQELLRLGGAKSGDSLELAPLNALGSLQLLGPLIEVPLAVLERLLAPHEIGSLQLEGLRLTKGALLHPGQLLAARLELIRRRGRGLVALLDRARRHTRPAPPRLQQGA